MVSFVLSKNYHRHYVQITLSELEHQFSDWGGLDEIANI